jgi:hypothetical protein
MLEGAVDLNGDGHTDLLLRRATDGAQMGWILSGTSVARSVALPPLAPSMHLVGEVPWTQDATRGATLYWQNDLTGAITRWEYDYQTGLQSTTANIALGRAPHSGVYLTSTPILIQTPTYAYVQSLYQDVLGRQADPAGLLYWTRQLLTGTARAQVVAALWNSAEHRGLEVDGLYAKYLHRAADPAGRAAWIRALRGGMGEDEVTRRLLTSKEFSRSHAAPAAFVTALYVDMLGRTPDKRGLALWTAAARKGVGRAAIISAFQGSREFNLRRIEGFYVAYFHRQGHAAEVVNLLHAMRRRRLTVAQVARGLLSSAEYYRVTAAEKA